MAIIFHLLIFLLTNVSFIASITLDVFYPDDMLMLPEYDEMCSHNYIPPINSNNFECKCQRPCQCHNRHPPPLIYSPPQVQYSPPAYQPPPIPTPPTIFVPTAPTTISPIQQIAPSFQTSQDQTKYNSVNYEHSHSETQQRPGRFIRWQSPPPHQPQIYFPNNQYNNFPNGVKTNYKRSPGSIFIRGRDSRSTLESSKTQNGNDVATNSSIITPQQQQLNNTIMSNIRKKRHNTNPQVFGKGINATNIKKTSQYEIVDPSRKLVNTASKPTPSRSRSSFNSADNIYVNNHHGNSNNNFGNHNGLDNKNMVIGNTRSSGLNGIRIFYPPDNYVHPTLAGRRQSSGNLQITPDYYNPYVHTPRSMK
ncbi:hypothetical protein PV327_003414 [Microctonus hyperodae]|uniref:Uncharacterized protein n=1 Tax=Microctonus hyperodae TaxID=165561 RepID=A0AA39G404_MICHY|nr:hypothetical protein PV327_003414 [Microctonus hyperodae]